MEIHQTYIGIKPFGVLIEKSEELEKLVTQAKELKKLPFAEKLEAIKKIALDSMVNAYEQSKTNPDPEIKAFNHDIVFSSHTLAEALEEKAGCCRYQGALFFVLGYEADLGDKHFLQQAPVDPKEFEYGFCQGMAKGGLRSVFNDVIDGNKIHHVSIFKESLQDSSLDYSKKNPQVFESAIGFGWPKENTSPRKDNLKNTMFSYHRTESGLVIISNESKHITKHP